jgi:hypothetical protein
MDANQFDGLAKIIASPSRRRLLRGVMAAGLTGLGLLQGGEAGAMHFDCLHVGKPCRRAGKCCSGRCRGPQGKKTCRAHHTGICKTSQDTCAQGDIPGNECGTTDTGHKCYCYITTGGAPYCVGGSAGFDCEKDEECYPELPGGACIVCTEPGKPISMACVLPCDNPYTKRP